MLHMMTLSPIIHCSGDAEINAEPVGLSHVDKNHDSTPLAFTNLP